MLQIEDENESKRTLHYDQCDRKVFHEFGFRYYIKIVGIIAIFYFYSNNWNEN